MSGSYMVWKIEEREREHARKEKMFMVMYHAQFLAAFRVTSIADLPYEGKIAWARMRAPQEDDEDVLLGFWQTKCASLRAGNLLQYVAHADVECARPDLMPMPPFAPHRGMFMESETVDGGKEWASIDLRTVGDPDESMAGAIRRCEDIPDWPTITHEWLDPWSRLASLRARGLGSYGSYSNEKIVRLHEENVALIERSIADAIHRLQPPTEC